MNVERHLIAFIHMSMWMLCFSVEIIYSMRVESGRLLAVQNMAKARWVCKAEDAISNLNS